MSDHLSGELNRFTSAAVVQGARLGHPDDSEPPTGRIAPPLIRHGACGKGWSGITRGHCGQCHETFSAGAFDPHQRIHGGVITCSTDGLEAREEPWGTLWILPDSGYWARRRAVSDPPEFLAWTSLESLR